MRSIFLLRKLTANLAPPSRKRNPSPTPCLIAGCILVFSQPCDAQAVLAALDPLKKLSLEELMDVEITSVSKRPEKLFEAAAAVQVITQEDIRRSGATNLPEALRLASNLQVAQKNSHDWGISARGFNTDLANKLLVMIDGRTIYTPLFSGVFWDVQDYLLEDIERIEVISGPGGTLWGANAVNGVINIITKSAKDTQGFYAEAGGGNILEDFAGARYGAALSPNVHARVYGKYFDRGNEVLADGSDARDASHMAQGGFRIDAELSSRDTLSVQGDVYQGAEQVPAKGDSDVDGANVLSRWTRKLSADSGLSLQMYYDRTHLSQTVPALVLNSITFAPAGTLKDTLDTYDLDFQHRFRLAQRHLIVWGLGYRYTHDAVENAPALAFLPATLNHSLFSGFIQDEIALRNNLSLTLGTKLEHNDYTGTEYEPSIRMQWTLSSQQTTWAAVSRAVRTPSRIDRDLSQAAPPNLVLLKGGANFTSETVIAYEAGYRVQVNPKLTGSIALFYNDYDDLRSASFTPTTILPFYFANNLQGETHGLELTATYQVLDNWRLRGGYNLLKEHLRIKPGQMDINNALNETADPQHQLSLRSSMDLPASVALDIGLRWVDTLHNNNGPTPGTVPSYFDADLRLGWMPGKRWELSVVGQNLLHAHHPEYGFPSVTRIEISRSVVGKVAWRFE